MFTSVIITAGNSSPLSCTMKTVAFDFSCLMYVIVKPSCSTD